MRRWLERAARQLGMPQHRIDRLTTWRLFGWVLWEADPSTRSRS